MLIGLADKFGENLVRDREHLFKLLGNDVESDKEYSMLVAHCYRRYAAFANYIDLMFYFGTEDVDMLQIVTDTFRSIAVELHYNKSVMGGRFLMEDNGYVYVAYDEGLEPPIKCEGVEVYRA